MPLFEAARFVVETFGPRDAAGVEAQASGLGLEVAGQPLLRMLIETRHGGFWILDCGLRIGLIQAVCSINKVAADPTVAAFLGVG